MSLPASPHNLTANQGGSNAVIYPAPAGEPASPDYELEIDGQQVFVHQARVSAVPLNQIWPGYQRPLEQTELTSFASWDMAGPVELKITLKRAFKTFKVRPHSSGINAEQADQTLTVKVAKPGQLVIEFDDLHHVLHCFANPLEENAPSSGAPNVIYFGPGVHHPGVIVGKSNQTIYLAGGAVVYGAIEADDVQGLRISGRGILDSSQFTREDFDEKRGPFGTLSLRNSTHCIVEGITLRDPHMWTLVPVNCSDLQIRHTKLIGLWRYNSDGIDIVTCQRVTIQDCFIRAFDDSIVLKGIPSWGPYPAGGLPIEDITVERCVLWNDWGRNLEIGAETATPHIRRIIFRDCDLIHVSIAALDIQHGDNACIEDVLFEDIRVEMDDAQYPPQFQQNRDDVYNAPAGNGYLPHLLFIGIAHTMWSSSKDTGTATNVRFKNIQVTAPAIPPSHFQGADADHLVSDIQIESLKINGHAAVTLEEGGIILGPFVKNARLHL